MGQYYGVRIADEKDDKYFVVSPDDLIGDDWNGLKLMEHSWWRNPLVEFMMDFLYKNPHRISWVGDYADDDPKCPKHIYEQTIYTPIKIYGFYKGNNFVYEDKFLVNHTTKEFINLEKYKELNDKNGWCIAPLPLLTAFGNGLGGGDYFGINKEDVGCWGNNLLSVEDMPPEGYTERSFAFGE